MRRSRLEGQVIFTLTEQRSYTGAHGPDVTAAVAA